MMILADLIDKIMIYMGQNTNAFLIPGNVGENVCSLKWINRNCYRNQHGSFKY